MDFWCAECFASCEVAGYQRPLHYWFGRRGWCWTSFWFFSCQVRRQQKENCSHHKARFDFLNSVHNLLKRSLTKGSWESTQKGESLDCRKEKKRWKNDTVGGSITVGVVLITVYWVSFSYCRVSWNSLAMIQWLKELSFDYYIRFKIVYFGCVKVWFEFECSGYLYMQVFFWLVWPAKSEESYKAAFE